MLLGFQPRFERPIKRRIKRHTIRAKTKLRRRVGDTCHCYTGLRQKGARLIGRWLCVRIQTIHIWEATAPNPRKQFAVLVDGVELLGEELELLAVSDGFDSFAEMMTFWDGRRPFVGDMIHWDPDQPMPAPKKAKRKVKRAAARAS